jgi:flagellar basal body-associated protein FliL
MMPELLVFVLIGLVIGICLVAVFAAWLYMTSKETDES